MMNKPKYMRRVFSGKTIPMIGLDQGKSKLYRGDGTWSVVNMMYDGSLRTREGQTLLFPWMDRLSKRIYLTTVEEKLK